jgi:hypothetical protein
MFPIGDDNTQRRTRPVVTYTLVAETFHLL